MAIETVFRVLGEPNRVKMVMLLGEKDCTVDQLRNRLGISQSSTSQHLKMLLRAGLATYSIHGNFRIYSLRTNELKKAMRFFDKFWDDGLKKMKAKLESKNE